MMSPTYKGLQPEQGGLGQPDNGDYYNLIGATRDPIGDYTALQSWGGPLGYGFHGSGLSFL